MNNPFLIVGYQGPEYFCDREKETEVILSALHNGRNITLVSPRRMGKTGLIKNVFYTLQEKEKNAKCFYLDIFSTQNLREFVALLGREILGKLDSLSQSTLKTLLSFFKSCRPVITMDELSGIPSVSLDIVPSKEEETLRFSTTCGSLEENVIWLLTSSSKSWNIRRKGWKAYCVLIFNFCRMFILSFRGVKST